MRCPWFRTYTIDVYVSSYHVNSYKHKFIPVPLHLLFQDQSAIILFNRREGVQV